MPEPFEHLAHPLLRKQVRDIASGAEGELTAVVHAEVGRMNGVRTYAPIAHIRMPSGLELTTAVANIAAIR
ncbi:hypothetical protein ACGFYU_34850 [Streptomyces sp. NPDC048337]|uniref:hypothetical protein n=1 Tax=Streptomyces sp. NPDC048337 TaxID=3365535 RepID=UPI00371FB72F